MTARHKLNTAHFHGALLIGGLVGWHFGSLHLFLLVSGILILSSLYSGEIRPNPKPRR